jgi:hypothetical protein
MLESLNESTGSNYAKRDGSADRLWLTQRTKVNPWDHRTPSDDASEQPGEPSPNDDQMALATPLAPMISQADTLRLETHRGDEVINPFERLIEHQLNRRPLDKVE